MYFTTLRGPTLNRRRLAAPPKENGSCPAGHFPSSDLEAATARWLLSSEVLAGQPLLELHPAQPQPCNLLATAPTLPFMNAEPNPRPDDAQLAPGAVLPMFSNLIAAPKRTHRVLPRTAACFARRLPALLASRGRCSETPSKPHAVCSTTLPRRCPWVSPRLPVLDALPEGKHPKRPSWAA